MILLKNKNYARGNSQFVEYEALDLWAVGEWGEIYHMVDHFPFWFLIDNELLRLFSVCYMEQHVHQEYHLLVPLILKKCFE